MKLEWNPVNELWYWVWDEEEGSDEGPQAVPPAMPLPTPPTCAIVEPRPEGDSA